MSYKKRLTSITHDSNFTSITVEIGQIVGGAGVGDGRGLSASLVAKSRHGYASVMALRRHWNLVSRLSSRCNQCDLLPVGKLPRVSHRHSIHDFYFLYWSSFHDVVQDLIILDRRLHQQLLYLLVRCH